MDATSESFANRCLPLTIANAAGWEILSPCGFSVFWRGGEAPDDVIVKPDPGTDRSIHPVGIFGARILTIHIHGLFRTPPGWDLWVRGSPNKFKEGVQALDGIVETHWSVMTFTMNWRLLRRNHTVRFDAGEPICFVTPVQTALLEQFRPRFALMKEEPGLQDQFSRWSASRNAFQEKVRQVPTSRADGWQKDYMRGRDMDDRKAAGHRSKLRLREFERK